ncbi:MAG TPA: M28 family peptidase [Gemmatimonadaceae bacterium]|nr:M28 family peptidase [Gemmatimonadaceae bacterium]
MARSSNRVASLVSLFALVAPLGPLAAQSTIVRPDTALPEVTKLVSRLSLDRYKATIKGLTQFGDRQQGTDRNRAAVDWIEKQLQSYGCTPTQRITYNYESRPRRTGERQRPTAEQMAEYRRMREEGWSVGGSRMRGNIAPTGVNRDSLRQPDPKLRALNTQQPVDGERQEVYCTKVGTKHPDQMYIIGGHMDGLGWGEAANDDGSGTALVMELARIFSMPDVQTDVSIRFILWNNEETGLNGAHAYVEQRAPLQGKESPAGSGKYPEPKWLGMIQHDMMMFDHGMPLADSTLPKKQRPEADVNIEFQSQSKFADEAAKLAWHFRGANERYATDYPAAVGPHMTNTDSSPFMDLIPAISLRENERGMQIGAGWNPNWHQPTDLYSTYSDDDFRLGLNAAQTTLGAIAELAGARLTK